MRLEYLCDMELTYREELLYRGIHPRVQPFGTEEGTFYGEGDGQVTGQRLQGKARWVNHPHRRSDGVMLPDVHGVIVTDEGAIILFVLQGRTVFKDGMGDQLLSVTFESQDEQYRWLNNAFCVLEGKIVHGNMKAHTYQCVNEYPLPG